MPTQTFDTLDAVPEEQRESAIETKAGKFLVVTEPDTSGLTTSLERERKAVKEAKAEKKKLEDRLAELELAAKGSAAGLNSEKLAELRAQVASEFEPKLKALDAAQAEIRALKLNDRVKALFSAAEFVSTDQAWKLFGEEFDLTDDGQPVVKAHPGKDVAKHVGELAAANPHLVKGSRAAGGGANGGKGGTTTATEDVFEWTPEQRADYVAKHGLAAYNEKLNATALAKVQKSEKKPAA
jgi:hypothetical protein